eukprot:COSAG02_NODE_1612_length_11675_cov_29.558310_6_plen_93_part_00
MCRKAIDCDAFPLNRLTLLATACGRSQRIDGNSSVATKRNSCVPVDQRIPVNQRRYHSFFVAVVAVKRKRVDEVIASDGADAGAERVLRRVD